MIAFGRLVRKRRPLETARVRENRLPRVEENYNGNIMTYQIPPVKSGELEVPEVPPRADLR